MYGISIRPNNIKPTYFGEGGPPWLKQNNLNGPELKLRTNGLTYLGQAGPQGLPQGNAGGLERLDIRGNFPAHNPFNNLSQTSAKVAVEPWASGKNNSLDAILKSQGYSSKEIYAKDANGKSLLDRVAATNNLKNANLVKVGQELTVPTKTQVKSAGSVKTADDYFHASERNFDTLEKTFHELNADEKKAIGKQSFYYLAMQSGQYKGKDGKVLSADQIKARFDKMKPAERKKAEAAVRQYAQDTPASAKLALSDAAATWATDQLQGPNSPYKWFSATPADQKRLDQLLKLQENGDAYVQNYSQYVNNR